MTYRSGGSGATGTTIADLNDAGVLQSTDLTIVRRAGADYKAPLSAVQTFSEANSAQISDLADITSLLSTDVTLIRRNGVDYRATLTELVTYLQATLNFGTGIANATAYTTSLGAVSGTSGTPVTVIFTPTSGSWPTSTVITPTVATLAGTFSPTTITPTPGTTAPVSCTFTPSSTAGTSGTINSSISPSMTNTSGAQSYAVVAATATGYTMTQTGSSGNTNVAHTLTFAPTGGVWPTGTSITPASNLAGTFSTLTLTAGSSGSANCTYTPTTAGTATISATNNKSWTNPSNLTYTVTNAPTITVTAPATGTAGAAMTLGGSYTGTAPTGVTYGFDSGATTTTVTGFSASGGTWTATGAYPGAAGSHTVTVVETNNGAVTATSSSFTTNAASSGDPSTMMTAGVGWWDAINSFTDAGAATQATTGQLVRTVGNKLSTGTRLLNAPNDPTYDPTLTASVANGLAALQGVAPYGSIATDGPASWLSALSGSWTFLLVYKSPGTVGVLDGNGTGPGVSVNSSDGQGPTFYYADAHITDTSVNNAGAVVVCVGRVNATNSTIDLKVEGASAHTPVSFTGGASAVTQLVCFLPRADGYWMELAISSAYESDSVRDSLLSYGRTRWGT